MTRDELLQRLRTIERKIEQSKGAIDFEDLRLMVIVLLNMIRDNPELARPSEAALRAIEGIETRMQPPHLIFYSPPPASVYRDPGGVTYVGMGIVRRRENPYK